SQRSMASASSALKASGSCAGIAAACHAARRGCDAAARGAAGRRPSAPPAARSPKNFAARRAIAGRAARRVWQHWPMHAPDFLRDLALVLCVAAVTTVLFRKLRQPVVLGYLLAGLLVGPHVPVPLLADQATVETLAELGVILVMFAVGLDFSLRRLAAVIPEAGLIGIIQVSSMLWLGYLAGQALGFSVWGSVFTGAALCISSTMVVARVFAEEGVAGRRAELTFAVLVVEDLAAVVVLARVAALAGEGHGTPLVHSMVKLTFGLAALVAGGYLVVPRAIRIVARLESTETLLVAAVGAAFALALVARALGSSVALGAFLAGSLVAESGRAHSVEVLVRPVRDMFAAIFFVAVGMSVDPGVLAS